MKNAFATAAFRSMTAFGLRHLLWILPLTTAGAANFTIHSDAIIRDDQGKPIHANSGDIIRSGDTWYWFGEDMTEYMSPSTTPGSSPWYAEFKGVNCYQSKDLVHWTFSNVVLKKQPSGEVGPNREVSRPHVVWNARTKKWVMLYHAENLLYDENMVGIATSDTIDGDYTFIKKFRPGGQRSLDLGVYQEGEDCYILYSWANTGQRIDKLTPDYMDVATNVFSIKEQGEAPVVIKREGVYYWVNSQLTGWDPNANFYRTGTSLAGPWSKKQQLAPDWNNTYGSQVFELIQADDLAVNGVRGGCIYVGDLFDLKDFAKSKTLWLPVQFTADHHMVLKKRDSWELGVTGPTSTSSSTSPSDRALAGANPELDDEFVGSFPSWINVKTECGATGDGTTDDTSALQKGLDLINPASARRKVLYVPAGVYRITKTLQVPRTEHAQTIGMGIIGEDPATTRIAWDGPLDGRMFYYSPWYARMMRLTLDGRGRAKDAVFHGPPFATALGYTDMVFKDVQFGIEAGERDGIAECLVLRCKFFRCGKAGINIQNFNSLDWWIWYSTFEDCHIGVSSEYNGGGGHFHVYESLFQNSTEADITIMHTSYFGIRHNTSINSKAFFVAKRAGNWTDKENYGAETAIQGNHIYDPIDATPIRIANSGNILLMDNVIRSRADVTNGPVVHQTTPTGDADMVSIGNTFTVVNPFDVKGRLTTQEEKTVSRNEIQPELPSMPGTAPNLHRQVFDLSPGASAEAIQHAIDAAAKLRGQRPVVHFPPGDYAIGKTLEIPAGADMILVGDSIMNGNNLNWTGGADQPVFMVHGPSHAIFRELYVNCAKKALGVRVDRCDQPGGRVNMQAVSGDNAPDLTELRIDGLDHTEVSLMGLGFSKITAIGGPLAQQGKRQTTQMVSYGYNCGSRDSYELQKGGSILMQDGWYEGGYRTFCRLSGQGTFTTDGGTVAVGTYPGRGDALPDRDSGLPAVGLDNFQGKATFIGIEVSSVDPARPSFIKVQGDRADMKALFLGCNFKQDAFTNAAAKAKVAVSHSRQGRKNLGTISVPDHGVCDAAFLREMLAQTRSARLKLFQPLKPEVTDVRFDRVFFRNGPRAMELLATNATEPPPRQTNPKP